MVHPVLLFVDGGHGDEKYRQDMCETEVEQKDLDQVPVLFVVEVVDEEHLQFLHF